MTRVIVLTGPTCAGKSALCEELLKAFPGRITKLITTTTRAKRRRADGSLEENGVDYEFVDDNTFKKHIRDNEFLEYTLRDWRYYGSSWQKLKDAAKTHCGVLMVVDPGGAQKIKSELGDKVLTIFVAPVNPKDLRKRLKERNSGAVVVEDVDLRIASIKEDMRYRPEADYILLNRDGFFEDTVKELCKVALQFVPALGN